MAMRDAVFVDASAFVALANPADVFHAAAKRIRDQLLAAATRRVTTNLIIHEVTAGLARKVSRQAAVLFGDHFFKQRAIQIVWATQNMETAAWQLYRRSSDPTLSLVDCASFVLMEEFGITRAFSFDRHFRDFGFTLLV